MSSMSRVLALDTATDACTLALCGEGDLRARHERLARAHNRHILGMLTDILAERSLASAVDVIACGVGPGSFTGLRVAVSVAQGLAWARDIPVHGFCSLSAQVYSAAALGLLLEGQWVLSTIDAQIGQLYGIWGQWREDHFHAEKPAFICPPESLTLPSELASVAVIGSGLAQADRFPEQLQQLSTGFADITPDAAVMAQRLSTGSLALVLQPAHALSPQYVQQTIGWKKLSEQRRHE
jgi:tRNA threonylcarbamoyladenosine biosynthesis protein TsaB